MDFFIQDLLLQISESNNELKKLDKEIILLKQNKTNNNSKIEKLKEENRLLKTTEKLCEEDIKDYNEQINKLSQKIKENEFEIIKLKKLNNSFKKEKSNKKKQKKNLINNIKDLQKTLKLDFLGDKDIFSEKNNEINENIASNPQIKIKNMEELQKKKTDYEIKFIEIKEKCNGYHQDIIEQEEIVENYKKFISEISQQINVFNEVINISADNNDNKSNNSLNRKKLDDIYNQINAVSINMIQLDEINFNIKKFFGDNVEHVLNEIYDNLLKIDRREYKDGETLRNIIEKIGHLIDEIQNICFIFEENKNKFYNDNHNCQEEVNKLNYLFKKYEKEYKKNIAKNIANQNINNNNIIKQNNNENSKQEELSFGFRNPNELIDFYKTTNLFNNNENDYLENYLEKQLLRKNWHQTCYIYDDYDIYDIYYDIKAVGLSPNHYFTSTSHGFYYNTIVEIQLFLINGIPSNFKLKNHYVEFKINLYNMQSARIHIIYKEIKDLKKLSRGEIEERKIIRRDYYGLDKSLSGQMGKFCLILRGTFDIVNFSKYFLVRNEKNLNEIEYVWGGRVPYGGIKTLIMFSKSEALWSFKFCSRFHSNQNIKNTTFRVPIEFIGGNNEILNINTKSPQTTNIILDEEKRQYIIRYINTNYKNCEFIIEGVLQNKSKGEWLVDLSNDEIEKRIPEEDKLCKPQLNNIAKKIISDFDKNNKNTNFKFVDFMKIGIWVHQNIKYNYKYIGKTELSAIDIYNKREGVCHHFTKLCNALLYSLGYKVLYISGYACKNSKEFNTDSGHAWSLIQLNNKWYPFDSTWGIFSGKLPISHIFGTFSSKSRNTYGSDIIHFDRQNMEGKYIE